MKRTSLKSLFESLPLLIEERMNTIPNRTYTFYLRYNNERDGKYTIGYMTNDHYTLINWSGRNLNKILKAQLEEITRLENNSRFTIYYK